MGSAGVHVALLDPFPVAAPQARISPSYSFWSLPIFTSPCLQDWHCCWCAGCSLSLGSVKHGQQVLFLWPVAHTLVYRMGTCWGRWEQRDYFSFLWVPAHFSVFPLLFGGAISWF